MIALTLTAKVISTDPRCVSKIVRPKPKSSVSTRNQPGIRYLVLVLGIQIFHCPVTGFGFWFELIGLPGSSWFDLKEISYFVPTIEYQIKYFQGKF